MSSRPPGRLAAVLITLGLLCLACGLGDKLTEQAAEEAFEQALEEAGAEGDVELDLGDEIDLSDLPEWLNYPNAKATGKMTMAQDGTEGTMYVLETGDELSVVVDWYKAAMSSWEQSASFETAESTQLVYTDGETQTVQLTFTTVDEQLAISCWYAKVEQEVQPQQVQQLDKPGHQVGGAKKPGIKGGPRGKGAKAGRRINR